MFFYPLQFDLLCERSNFKQIKRKGKKMYSLKFVTENNKEYSFENLPLETNATFEQNEAVVSVIRYSNCSKISIQVENDRVKNIYHTYSTSLRNFNKAIVPDSGRNFIGMSQQTVYFWTKCYETRVNDIKTPLYILCGQDNCSSLCFGVIGQDYERDFVSLEPHGGRALSLYSRTLTLQIKGEIPAEYRSDVFEEGTYLMDEAKDTGIPWTETLREFHEIRQAWKGIVFPYTKDSMYPMWCSWTDWDSANVNDQIVLDNVDEGVKLGIRNYIADDGWFGLGLDCDEKLQLNIGDWTSDPSKFKDIKVLSEKIREKGGKSIIWCAPHAVGDLAKVREERMKYLMRNAQGQLVRTSNGFNVLCMKNPEAREIMADICVRLALEYGTDGAKYDLFNCIPDVPCCCDDHEHDTDSMVVALQKTMELIWTKIREVNPNYIVELKQNYGGSKLATYGTMMRAGDTPYCPEGNFLRTAYIQSYTPYAANDYQTITNHDSLESAAKVIIKMLAVGIPTYSMDLVALNDDKKNLIQFLNNWYIENIVEKENFKRTAMNGMLDIWCANGTEENLYFAVNAAKEVQLKGNFQLLNASMYSELFLTAEENANYNLQFWNHAGELIEELSNVSGTFKISSNVMLVKGKKVN